MADTVEDMARRSAEAREAAETVARLQAALAELPTVEARLAACEATVEEQRRRAAGLERQMVALGERLRQLDELAERLRERRTELAALERESGAYTELGRMFGKTGIQAMVIDNALPELETSANALLGRMSDGTMQVQFATQAQGSRGDLLETLDIKIADSQGTRPYEMFSGGEAFRVNFAIRIALSRLLAERAGAQLQMLVVDEGFGTQDGQGRERLVEAINAIASDFEKIMVITHIDELKDLFDVRLDVVKGRDGSRVTVTAI
jgi:exonuclease SbcC